MCSSDLVKKIGKAVVPEPEPEILPPVPVAAPVITVDLSQLTASFESLAATTRALTRQTAAVAAIVLKSRRGTLKVNIQRDSKGNMETLVIEPVSAPS